LTPFESRTTIEGEGVFIIGRIDKEDRIKKRTLKACLIGFFAAAYVVLSPGLWAKTEFKGRLFMGGGPNRANVVSVRILLNEYTSEDEVRRLSQFLNAGDIEGFYGAFREMKKGELRFIGGLGLKVVFNAATEQKTENGYKILFATEGRSLEMGTSKRISGGYLFLVVELNLNNKYEGEGKVYENAKIQFTPAGSFVIESYVTPPKMLVAVQPVK